MNRRIRALSNYRPPHCVFSNSFNNSSEVSNCRTTSTSTAGHNKQVVDRVPEELLVTKIFPHLDDIQLFMCSKVCRRWQRIILSLGLPWRNFVMSRWPLFSPQYEVIDWYEAYGRLVDSTFCHRCLWSITPLELINVECPHLSSGVLQNTTNQNRVQNTLHPQAVNRGWSMPASSSASNNFVGVTDRQPPVLNQNVPQRNFWSTSFTHSASAGFISSALNSRVDQDSWRNRRLLSEFQNLKCDPFLGIDAVRLDPGGYLWQASVEG